MIQDDVTQVVKSDALILHFGSYIFQQFGFELHLRNVVSSKMREFARLLMQARKVNTNINNLVNLLKAQNFDTIVKSVECLCQLNTDTGKFKTPTLVTKLGQSLIKCAYIIRGCAIKLGSDTMLKLINDFIAIFNLEWKITTKHATKTLYQAKWNKPSLIPFAEDIRMFNTYQIICENCTRN